MSVDASGARGRAGDAAILIGLFAASVVVRAPMLLLIPRFTDEVRRVLWSLRILEGGFWPLAYKNGYNGALMIYANAAALAVRPEVSTPRWMAVLVASAAPPALYLLVRELGGRAAGLVAALLLVTSFVPVVVFGHIPWAITPAATLAIAGLWLAVRALRVRSARSLVAAGATLGLAVQTHPLALLVLPGAGLWWLAQARRIGWPSRRAAAAALAAAALAYAPLVAHHALAWARDGRLELTSTRDLRDGGAVLEDYPTGAVELGGSLVDVLAAQPHDDARPRGRDPFAWLVAALALGAMAWTAWRGPGLPAAATAGGLLLLPALVQTLNFPLSARYTGLLLPTIYAAIGLGVADGWRGTRRRAARRVPVDAAFAALVALLVLVPLRRIDAYYGRDVARGRTNAAVLALAEATRARWSSTGGPAVVLDDEIAASFSASGNLSRVLEALLGLHGVPVDKVATAGELDEALDESTGWRWVIASDALRAAARRGPRLEPVDGAHVPQGDDGDGYGLYGWSPGAATAPER